MFVSHAHFQSHHFTHFFPLELIKEALWIDSLLQHLFYLYLPHLQLQHLVFLLWHSKLVARWQPFCRDNYWLTIFCIFQTFSCEEVLCFKHGADVSSMCFLEKIRRESAPKWDSGLREEKKMKAIPSVDRYEEREVARQQNEQVRAGAHSPWANSECSPLCSAETWLLADMTWIYPFLCCALAFTGSHWCQPGTCHLLICGTWAPWPCPPGLSQRSVDLPSVLF